MGYALQDSLALRQPVDHVGQHGLDDGVLAVGDVGGRGVFDAVGQERVIPPYREQFLDCGAVADTAYEQLRGDRRLGGDERGELDFGDLGVADQLPGVRVDDGAGVA